MRTSLAMIAAFVPGAMVWSWPAAEGQDRPVVEQRQVAGFERPSYLLARAPAEMREVWIGLPAPGIEPQALLQALRAICSDQTAVAVLQHGYRPVGPPFQNPPGSEEERAEREALDTVLSKAAFADLSALLGLRPETPARVVWMGLFEGAARAARLATSGAVRADGLVLLDPPVSELPRVATGDERKVEVDVFLCASSLGESERDAAEVLERLGRWGQTARIFHAGHRLATLAERVGDAVQILRGFRIYRSHDGAALQVEELVEELAGYDVVFIGELHGNPAAHRLQREVLEGLLARDRPLALATEQFERDVQAVLDAYLKGDVDEAGFLGRSRPWPNYADYRPLVELCKRKGAPIIAGNIPRRLASRIAKEGPEALGAFTEEERRWSARQLRAEEGPYKTKFLAAMQGMQGHGGELERMYAAQCIKDDTMAESVAAFLEQHPNYRILHINGAFHSEGRLGVPEKLALRLPALRMGVVTCIEADNPMAQALRPEDARANEFVVYVLASRPRREAARPSEAAAR